MIEQIESPCSSVGPLFSQGLQAYERAVTRLLKDIPQLGAILKERFDTSGWQAMEARFRAYMGCRDRGMNPPLVVTMFGPSGAGKSTVFRSLTGLRVPAGEEIRPTTRHCVVAVPSALCQQEVLESIFPHQELIRLRSPEEIRQPSRSDSRLFYAPMSSEPSGNGEFPPLILADVPDFNTVESENWKRAEQMLSRAELTIFLVYSESYSDNKTVEMLAKCCRLSQLLVYVFTKTGREAAQAKWQHLLEIVRDRKDFQEVRSDGQTLAEFLARSVCYYSPRITEDGGEESLTIEALEEGSPPFVEFIRGQLAERLVVGALAQSACVAVPTCREALKRGQEKLQRLQSDLSECHARFCVKIKDIAASTCPNPKDIFSEIVVVIEQFVEKSPLPVRLAGKTVIGGAKGIGSLVKGVGWSAGSCAYFFLPRSLKDLIKKHKEMQQSLNSQPVKPLEATEKEKADKALQQLVEELRDRFAPESTGESFLFSSERCHTAIRNALRSQWPLPSRDWRTAVRSETELWIVDHKFLAYSLAGLSAGCVVAGGTLLVVDLMTTGGTGTTVITSLGGGAIAGGMMTATFGAFGLDQVGHKGYHAWVKQRSDELQGHLEKVFYRILFEPWLKEYERLSSIDFAEALKACDELEALAGRSKIA